MDFKTYITIFFATVFLGKFLVMDSKILVALMEVEEVVYINPFCEKQNAKSQGTHETFSEDSHTLNITIDTFCNAPFQFEVIDWENKIIPEESRAFAYHTPTLPESAMDRFYPPPKV